MAIVNALQFDAHSGAMLSDEEYWLLRRRKSFFSDSLHDALDEDLSAWFGADLVIGICGNPSFGFEVVQQVRRAVRSKAEEARKKGSAKPPFTTAREIALLAGTVVKDTVRRRLNDKLRFLYGFEADDLIRGSFESGGRKIEIKQGCVKKSAVEMLEGKDSRKMIKDIFDNRFVFMGYDSQDLFSLHFLNAENCVLSKVGGGFEAIGKGKYASALSLGEYMTRHTLAGRKAGYDRVEGVFQLLLSGLVASRYFQEVGGDFHIALMDGRQKPGRLRFVDEDRVKLATEAVIGAREGLVLKSDAMTCVDSMIFGKSGMREAEAKLFAAASDRKQLELVLRGYRPFGLPGYASAVRKPAPGRRKASR